MVVIVVEITVFEVVVVIKNRKYIRKKTKKINKVGVVVVVSVVDLW